MNAAQTGVLQGARCRTAVSSGWREGTTRGAATRRSPPRLERTVRETAQTIVIASMVVLGTHAAAIVLGGATALPDWLVGAQAGAVLAWATRRPRSR